VTIVIVFQWDSLMPKIVFELCAESVDACLIAREGGAARIELCSALSEDGVTPSHALIREAVEKSGLPVHVLLRPRSGNFVYTSAELDVMRGDVEHARTLGASGIVIGMLRPDGHVDTELTREFVTLAGSLEVTFNRAFDRTVSLEQALEDIISTGCGRVLTSGGRDDVFAGADCLSRLVAQSSGRIDIAVGGGLRIHNAQEVARRTGARHFHGSLRRVTAASTTSAGAAMIEDKGLSTEMRMTVDLSDIRSMVAELNKV
jgi:copper homeostasis protein